MSSIEKSYKKTKKYIKKHKKDIEEAAEIAAENLDPTGIVETAIEIEKYIEQ